VQYKDDGTHAILPVAAHVKCETDHVGLPVMWLRHSHGKLRRDGFPAALVQYVYPVDERGRLHGALGLIVVEEPRVLARIRGTCRRRERKQEWLRERRLVDRLRGQDKSREVRRGRAAEKRRHIRLAARGATAHDSLPIHATRWTFKTMRTSCAWRCSLKRSCLVSA
jgi:hypothetical protein